MRIYFAKSRMRACLQSLERKWQFVPGCARRAEPRPGRGQRVFSVTDWFQQKPEWTVRYSSGFGALLSIVGEDKVVSGVVGPDSIIDFHKELPGFGIFGGDADSERFDSGLEVVDRGLHAIFDHRAEGCGDRLEKEGRQVAAVFWLHHAFAGDG